MDLRTRLGHGCNIGGVAARILKLFKSPFSSNASAVFTAFDFAAINVIPLDVWFIIPGLMINLGILLTPGKPDGRPRKVLSPRLVRLSVVGTGHEENFVAEAYNFSNQVFLLLYPESELSS